MAQKSTSEEPRSTSAVDSVVNALINPEVRASAAEKLNADIDRRREELAQLEAARDALVPRKVEAPAPKGRPRKAGATGKAGRPAGPGADHGGAIRAALKGQRAGLTLSDLHEAITKAGHEVDKKTIATYLRNMINREEVGQEGERGSFRYKLVTNGKS